MQPWLVVMQCLASVDDKQRSLESSEGEETNYAEDRGEAFIKVMTLDFNCKGWIELFF